MLLFPLPLPCFSLQIGFYSFTSQLKCYLLQEAFPDAPRQLFFSLSPPPTGPYNNLKLF